MKLEKIQKKELKTKAKDEKKEAKRLLAEEKKKKKELLKLEKQKQKNVKKMLKEEKKRQQELLKSKPSFNQDSKKDELDTLYIEIKVIGSNKKAIYIVPKNVSLTTGDKIKFFETRGEVKTAIVLKGNFSNKKYISSNYNMIRLVDYDTWAL